MDSDSPRAPTASSRGQWVVIGMFALALAATALAWWWNYQRGQRALAFFGPQAARLIRSAPHVEILVLRPADGEEARDSEEADTIVLSGSRHPIERRIDISHASGLLNARSSLLDDASYAAEPPGTLAPQSIHEVIRFADGDHEALIAITEPAGLLENLSSGKSLPLVSKTASGWRSFLARHTANRSPAKR
jgi:hypothetical protein